MFGITFFEVEHSLQAKRKKAPMLEIHKLQEIALANGFRKTRTSEDGTVLWLSKNSNHLDSGGTRICIDAVTRSATTFRSTNGTVFESKTFRDGQEMQSWLELA
jgi:hypothetical protein